MAPSSPQQRPLGLPGGSTTIAIVLVLVIPTVMLLSICTARRMSWFQPVQQRLRAAVPRCTRQPGAAGPESLRSLPVVRYDEKLFNVDVEIGEFGDAEETAKSGRGVRKSIQSLRGLGETVSRLRWSLVRFSDSHRGVPGAQRESTASNEDSEPRPEVQAKRLTIQACGICTEDFSKGTKVRRLPCGHIFHPRCIDPWLVNFAATCPLCRIDLSVKEATSSIPKPRPAAVPRPASTVRFSQDEPRTSVEVSTSPTDVPAMSSSIIVTHTASVTTAPRSATAPTSIPANTIFQGPLQ